MAGLFKRRERTHPERGDAPFRIAFFDYPDVFEDFYPAYGISIKDFTTSWIGTGNHLFVDALQQSFADITWYAFSTAKGHRTSVHEAIGCRFEVFRSSSVHRFIWWQFYNRQYSWRLHKFFRTYEFLASYAATLSFGFLFQIARNPPDAFFLQDYASGRFDVVMLIARALGRPVFAYHSGSAPERYIAPRLKRFTLPRADHLIASSKRERDMLVKRFNVDPARVSVVLTPVSTDDFRPIPRDEACCQVHLSPARKYFLFVGRLEDRIKRVSKLIEGFAALVDDYNNYDLFIVGSGPDQEHLTEMAHKIAPGRIFMTGWISSMPTKCAYYNAAECLVLPSASEGFPTVIAEAMSCGTPVAATPVGGVEELVHDGATGWILPTGSVAEISGALRRIAEMTDDLEAMRSAALNLSRKRCSPEIVGSQLKTIMKGSATCGD